MERRAGIYVMQIASMLTSMHPQTLRKYERAGFILPSRSNTLRLYSDDDIARLMMIKHLVEEVGLNLAGVKLALQIRVKINEMKGEIASLGIGKRAGKKLEALLDEMLAMLET